MTKKTTYKLVMFFILLTTFVLPFQNCAKSQFAALKYYSPIPENSNDQSSLDNSLNNQITNEEQAAPTPTEFPAIPVIKKCSFNGQNVPEGQSRRAYQNSTVPFGQNCVSEERFCINGQLDGNFNYASCTVDAPAACIFNGQTIAHNSEVTAYQQSNVAFGSSCKNIAEQRKCINGQLSGTFSFANCNIDAPAACLFNGQTIAHGGQVTAYQNSSTQFGSECKSESRQCLNGQLLGSFNFASCAINSPASCIFNGQTIAHGQNVNAYAASTVSFGSTCQVQSRTCDNGVLSGTHTFATCQTDAPASCLFNGQTLAHGQSVNAYLTSTVSFGSSCQTEARTCDNGTLSGTNTFASCKPNAPASCLLNGKTIAHGEVVSTFAKNSVSFGQTCDAILTSCSNGQLSNSNPYTSCEVKPKPVVVNIALGVRGDCSRFSCPSNAPYLIGCSLQNLGSDGRFLVQYNRTKAPAVNDTYIQEGDNCGKGGFSGNITCSSEYTANLNATSCSVYWLNRGVKRPVTGAIYRAL